MSNRGARPHGHHFKNRDDAPAPHRGGVGAPAPSRLASRPRRQRGRARIAVLGVLCGLVVALLCTGAFAFFSAQTLKSQASEVKRDMAVIGDAIKAHDYAAAADAAQDVANITSDMRDGLASPLWTAASIIPVYGQDVSSARVLIASLNDVAVDAFVPLTESLQANPPTRLITPDKTIDVAALTRLFSTIGDASAAIQRCTDTVTALPAFHIAKVEEMVAPAREKLVEANDLIQKAVDFSPLVEAVFGSGGNRAYLIAAQNSAEMRASGGFPGSLGVLRLEQGKIELDDFSRVYDVMEEHTSDSIALTDEELALFGESFMTVARDAGMDPDFTRVADIWSTAYEEKTGRHVDGVISVTPAVVQGLLGIAGPITLADGMELDGSNATKILQSDLYWKYLSKDAPAEGGNDAADALFAQAANLAFDKFFSGLNSDSLMEFIKLMSQGMDDRSVMFWLSDAAEQEKLTALSCSGALKTDPAKPAVGTFLSLWIGSKMGYYIDIDNEILGMRENEDGSRTYTVTTTYRNTATPDIVAAAGDYIAGSLPGFDQDNLYPDLLIYAPTGGSISSFEAGASAEFVDVRHEGLQVLHAFRPDFRAGDSIVCTYEVTTAPGKQEDLTFMSTPTLTTYR